MDARLRDVEITFGKVDQRLLTIERTRPPQPGRQQAAGSHSRTSIPGSPHQQDG